MRAKPTTSPCWAATRRGDAFAGALVKKLQASAAWRGLSAVAIVITFDEGAGKKREGCCGVTPDALSNFGGGHIPTIVITNHGPCGLAHPTPVATIPCCARSRTRSESPSTWVMPAMRRRA